MITKELLTSFRADMEQAMKAVYEKHGLTASPSKFTYGDHWIVLATFGAVMFD